MDAPCWYSTPAMAATTSLRTSSPNRGSGPNGLLKRIWLSTSLGRYTDRLVADHTVVLTMRTPTCR